MSKTSKRRRENTALVEANWPTNWSARDSALPRPAAEGSLLPNGRENHRAAITNNKGDHDEQPQETPESTEASHSV